MKPTDARATAPVPRFARLERRGKEEEVDCEALPSRANDAEDVTTLDFATCCLSELRVVKYSAEPKLVRMTDGSVPRHNCLRVSGPLTISRNVCATDAEPDCWTLVFSRSAGWSNEAEMMPVPRPARKWNAVVKNRRFSGQSCGSSCWRRIGSAYKARTAQVRLGTWPCHLWWSSVITSG